MHPTAARFAERAREEHDFDPDVTEFPEGTKTAADAAAAVGCAVAQIVKSVVLVADGESLVVLTAGDHRVDTAALAGELGADSARTATAEEVKEATGWSIGGVPPFCHDGALPVYLDASLLEHDRIWAAAGTPDAVFSLSPDELRTLASAEPVEAFTPA